ncbi:MAG: hypothetical protein J6B06_00790 [Lachnospiraceae bacterium]|nr:hypothetical protein [Lachnospiraceae bacterium]
MGYYEEYKKLQEQMIQQANLEGRKYSLDVQRKELEEKVWNLELRKDAEQRDVDKLEGRSLANFFYAVTGQMQKHLDKEKQEAYAAAVKYDAALCELEAVKKDIADINRMLMELRGCKERYQELLKKYREELKTANTAEGEKITRLEERITALESRNREIKEALSAGKAALSLAEDILKSLNTAEGYGTWDVLGGGLIADMAKHSALDEAQSKVEGLQVRLRRFQTELADVYIQANMKVSIDGFERFADYFFDGIFADWMVLNKISNSKSQVSSVINQLKDAVRKLEDMQRSTEAEIKSNTVQIQEVISTDIISARSEAK